MLGGVWGLQPCAEGSRHNVCPWEAGARSRALALPGGSSCVLMVKGHASVLTTFPTHRCCFAASVPSGVQQQSRCSGFVGCFGCLFVFLAPLTPSGVRGCPQCLCPPKHAPARGTRGLQSPPASSSPFVFAVTFELWHWSPVRSVEPPAFSTTSSQ